MLGFSFHPGELVALAVDREKFIVQLVPRGKVAKISEEISMFFAQNIPNNTRRVLVVEGIETLQELSQLHPDQKCRVLLKDSVDNLATLQIIPVDLGPDKAVLSVGPLGLNPALMRLQPSELSAFTHGSERFVESSESDLDEQLSPGKPGVLKIVFDETDTEFTTVGVRFILGLASEGLFKKVSSQYPKKSTQLKQFADTKEAEELAVTYMDVALYNTPYREAALFSHGNLEDLRFCMKVLPPKADLKFKSPAPEKLKLARES